MQICTTVPLHFPKERRRGLIKEDLMREMATFTGKEIIFYCYNMLLLDLMLPNGQSTIHCINTTKPYWVMHWILIYPNLNLISYKYYWMCMHDLKLVGFHVPVQKSVCFCKLFFYIAFFHDCTSIMHNQIFLKSFLHSFSYGQGHSPSFHAQLLWCTHSSEELRNKNNISTAPWLFSCRQFL